MKSLLFFVCFLLASFFNYAQTKYSITDRNAIKTYERARYQLDLNNFNEAILDLNLAIKQDENFIEAFLLLGDIYRSSSNNLKAKENYKKSIFNI